MRNEEVYVTHHYITVVSQILPVLDILSRVKRMLWLCTSVHVVLWQPYTLVYGGKNRVVLRITNTL
jgi:hypothetical protein